MSISDCERRARSQRYQRSARRPWLQW